VRAIVAHVVVLQRHWPAGFIPCPVFLSLVLVGVAAAVPNHRGRVLLPAAIAAAGGLCVDLMGKVTTKAIQIQTARW
jgi:hypothetical protein